MGGWDEALRNDVYIQEETVNVVKPFWGAEFVLRAGGLLGLKRDGSEEDARAWATHLKSRLRFVGSMINSISCASSSTYEGYMQHIRAHLLALLGRVTAISIPNHLVRVRIITRFLGVIGLWSSWVHRRVVCLE